MVMTNVSDKAREAARQAAEQMFDAILGDVASYAEFDMPSYREGAIRTLEQHVATLIDDMREECADCLPDDIDLFRTIRSAPVKTHAGIAKHIVATHWPAIRQLKGSGDE